MMKPTKDAKGNLITKEDKQRQQSPDHFKGLLSRPSTASRPEMPPAASVELPVIGHQSSNESRNLECDQATEVQMRRQQ
ncbi:unnamed protein product [Trichobilharzia regenti]|nr:unnamed protein product [Trichobilharzia regenti]